MWKDTLSVRLWSLRNVFLLWFIKPSIVELNDQRAVVRIPLNWRTKRHDIHAMYLGTLCMGADVAGGLIMFNLVRRSKANVSFVFKDIHGDFFKRAEGAVHFTCSDGPLIQDLVARALASDERQEAMVTIVATVPKKLGDEPVAKFTLTLSVKRRGSSR